MATSRMLYVVVFFITLTVSVALPVQQCQNARFEAKPRAFVLTDISNEPDDQMSLVRLLTYANEIDIQGIAAVTSTWLNSSTDEPTVRTVVSAYGNVTSNLNANVPAKGQYPPAAELLQKVHAGHPVYGLASLALNASDAALALVAAGDASSTEKPLWVCIWAGAAVLAEALNYINETRGYDDAVSFAEKLRVYSISDQDDAGPWIRDRFPQLFYVVSLHGFSEYTQATWTGISGELLRHFDKGGPNTSLVTNDWLQEHIRIGNLGRYYLNYSFIMEGDTPSFFPLIQNGLGDPEHPEWGNWGGRYVLHDASGRHRIFSNTADFVQGVSGDTYFSNFASIWRWRQGYQWDFAARMSWSANGDFSSNNHQPVVVVNDTCGPSILQLKYKFGESIVLDASKSWDPDGDELNFDWFHYREVVQRLEGNNIDIVSHNVTIQNLNPRGSIVNVTPLANLTMHIILTVFDNREIKLATYRRVILNPTA